MLKTLLSPLPNLRPNSRKLFLGSLLIAAASTFSLCAEDESAVTIQFRNTHTEIRGVVTGMEPMAAWVETARNALPNSKIECEQFRMDAAVLPMTKLPGLDGLLTELALSTRGGTVRFTQNSISIHGLTDSLVAHAAIQIRLEEIASDAAIQIHNGIEVVPADVLANCPLPSLETPAENPALRRLADRN